MPHSCDAADPVLRLAGYYYQCSYCGDMFRTLAECKAHLPEVPPKVYEYTACLTCPNCGEKLCATRKSEISEADAQKKAEARAKELLDIHMETCFPPAKKWSAGCPYCGKVFTADTEEEIHRLLDEHMAICPEREAPPVPPPPVPLPEETESVKVVIHPYMKLIFKPPELLGEKTSTRDMTVDATNLREAKLRIHGKLETEEIEWFVIEIYGGFSYKLNAIEVFVATDFDGTFDKTVDVTGVIMDGMNAFQGVLWVQGVIAPQPIWVEFGSELTLTYPKGQVPAKPVGVPEQPKEEEEKGWEEKVVEWAPWIIGGLLIIFVAPRLLELVPRPREEKEVAPRP